MATDYLTSQLRELPLFRGTDAIAQGMITHRDLRAGRYRRLFRDVYSWNTVPVTHELRAQAAAMALPPGVVITGRSAAAVRGAPICWPDDPVHVAVPLGARVDRRSGLLVRRADLVPDEYEPWEGGLLASPLRMCLDLLVGRPLPDSVADLDQILKARLVDRDALRTMLRIRHDNGIVVARQAEALATDLSDSVPESQVRVHLVLAGLDPVPQHWIELAGEQVALVDLAFPRRRVAVEYDGGWRDGETWALNRDRARLNRVQAAGWRVVFVTAALLRNPNHMVAEISAALSSHH
ncbi:endonuclease domain-containing protein [Pseudonocardia pini]|uniref:endonuclease domain-containing protein n=1 Tax=Pseudonocardia pini TaxID=2758030 RepID=UPI0015F0CFC1|nr:hypothetical protein [Pseudonocardia pini]